MSKIFENKKLFLALILFLLIGGFLFWNHSLNNVEDVLAASDCVSGGGLTCTATTYGSYTINTYTGSSGGSYSWIAPTGVTSVEYLVVGGGGGGGTGAGGGGGAGGVLTGSLSVTSGSGYTVTVGTGGSGSTFTSNGQTNGGNSVFSNITAYGGGYGFGQGRGTNNIAAASGGSGGGGGHFSGYFSGASGTSGQGNSGGSGHAGSGSSGSGDAYCGGGGGGAGGAGSAGLTSGPGNGGSGIASSITGTSQYYGGGGGAGSDNDRSSGYSSGGTGGGGAGGTNGLSNSGTVAAAGIAGTANTGGGGGGGNNQGAGAAGGSGIVIIRYITPPVNGSCGSSNGSNLSSAPTANLCSVGTASSVSGSGPWSWTCAGSSGGTTASCSANLIVNGTCGTSNGGNFYSAPTADLCTSGTASSVSGSGPWSWTCVGVNGGTNASCTANLSVGGSCGSSHGSSFSSIPTTNLCTSGTASSVSGSGPWTWTCAGVSGGGTPLCMANATISGGLSRSGLYTIEKYIGVGSINWTVPTGVNSTEALVVAGGGGGGMDMGGGGGGGGVIHNTSVSLTPGTPNTITVGAGGIGAPAASTNGQPSSHQYTIPATSGGSSSIGSLLTAVGGGFGGSSYRGYSPGIAGGAGGSGGGASGYNDNAGTFYGGAGTSGQGNRGGNSTAAYYSGGGGGAGAAGGDSTSQANGGIGYSCSILGTAYYWGGGGGGAGYSICGGNGGAGGGGGGAVCTTTGGSGLNSGSAGGGGGVNSWAQSPGGDAGAYTGGGGGGGSHYNSNNRGGNGGSGIVVIKYLTQYLTGWSYRKPVTISNTSATVLTNHQIKLTVSYVSSMNSDFSDLRFTRLDGVTLLPYWIESYTASSTATVWVKVDSIPTAGTQIFMYYGNSSASSISSFDNTNVFSTTGLVDWLKVDSLTGISDGASVAALSDSSGNGNNAVQATSTQQPIYKTGILNGKPVLRFTAASSQTMTVSTNFPAPVTVLYVGRLLGTTNARMLSGLSNNWLLGFWGGGKKQGYFEGWVNNSGVTADASWYIYSATIGGSGVNSSLYENGAILASNQNGITGPNGLSLGGNGEFSDGDIAEVLVYNSVLSPLTRSDVERYLANKYNITYSLYYTEPTSTFGTAESIGACGSSNGQSLVLAPTTNLCSAGTASSVSGSGPWTWTCTGTLSTASCSANSSAHVSTVYSSSTMSCFVTDGACSGSTIFNMEDYAGGHAELYSGSVYGYKVCCTGTGVSNSCSGGYGVALRLSGTTNAHAEQNNNSNSAYTSNVCISGSTGMACTYGTSCSSVGSNYVCLASISGSTNAHVAECGIYSTQVCCQTAIPTNSCIAKISSVRSVAKSGSVQVCSDADITNSSDPCYSICWTGSGDPDVTSSSWKCSTCKDTSNNTIPCFNSGATYTWTLSGGHSSSSDYTITSGSLSSANVVFNFNAADSTRKATMSINNNLCSATTSALSPIWKEVSPF